MQTVFPLHGEPDTRSRERKEHLLGQRGLVIWLMGLSGSGKTTLAQGLEGEMERFGLHAATLDGDVLRQGLNQGLGFSQSDRHENLRRAAQVARILLDSGLVAICSFITPLHDQQQMVREIIGAQDLVLVHVDCPLEVCEKRDVKGLYQKARRGELGQFTGISAPFQVPDEALVVSTNGRSVSESVQEILDQVLPRITLRTSYAQTGTR